MKKFKKVEIKISVYLVFVELLCRLNIAKNPCRIKTTHMRKERENNTNLQILFLLVRKLLCVLQLLQIGR